MLRVLLITILALSLGCSEDESPQANADNTTTPSSNEGFTLPTIDCPETDFDLQCPELPRALPTPPLLEDGTDFSNWEVPQCGLGMMPVFGTQNCTSVGTPCPTGDWPEVLPEGTLIFVKPGGTGDGSSTTNPLGSIQAAVNGSVSGSIIVLSKGIFTETLMIQRAVQIIGACSRNTLIDSSAITGSVDASLQITGAGDVQVENLTIRGPRRGIDVWATQSAVRLQGIILDGNQQVGLLADGSGVNLSVEETIISNTQSAPGSGTGGRGISLVMGAQLTLKKVLLDNNQDAAIATNHEGTTLQATDVVVLNTQSRALDGTRGYGLFITEKSHITLERAFLSHNQSGGLKFASRATGDISDLSVVFTQGDEVSGDFGSGIIVSDGSVVSARRIHLDQNREVGLLIADADTSLTVEDAHISRTQGHARSAIAGKGVEVRAGARLTATRMLLSENRELGLLVGQPGSMLTAEDLVIQHTQARDSDLEEGRGFSVQAEGQANITRAFLDANRSSGVVVTTQGVLDAQDLVVWNTLSSLSQGRGGQGLSISDGGRVTLNRTHLSNNQLASIVAIGEGTYVSATQLVINGTRGQMCSEEGFSPACEQAYGDGLLVLGGVELSLNSFSISDSSRVGLYLFDPADSWFTEIAEGSPLLATNGQGDIINNKIGLNLWGAESAVATWLDNFGATRCTDNTGTVDGCYDVFQQLPVPDPSESLTDIINSID